MLRSRTVLTTCIVLQTVILSRHFGLSDEFTAEIITTPPKGGKTSVKSGVNFATTCYVNNLGPDQVVESTMWTNDLSPDGIKSTGRLSVSNKNNKLQLLIAGAKLIDSGRFTCVAKVRSGETVTELREWVELSVYEGVFFTNAPKEQHPVQGDSNGRLYCEVGGTGPIEITWTKDGSPFSDDGTQRPLTFEKDGQILQFTSPVVASDNGAYTCEAIQSEHGGYETREITVLTYTHPSFTEETRVTVLKVAVEDTTVDLPCVAFGEPKPNVTWYRGNAVVKAQQVAPEERISFGDNGGVLTIAHLTPSDAGAYTCEASNGVGESIQRTLNLSVTLKPKVEKIEAPQYFMQGEDVTIPCKYSSVGDGHYDAQWKRGETVLTSYPVGNEPQNPNEPYSVEDKPAMQITLKVPTFDTSEADTYRCVVSNDAGVVVQDVSVVLKKSPKVELDLREKIISTVLNRVVSVLCKVTDAAPPVSVQRWTFMPTGAQNERDVTPSDVIKTTWSPETGHATLEITGMQTELFGTYTCKAKNIVTEAHDSVEVLEIVAPPAPEMLEVRHAGGSYVNISVDTWGSALPRKEYPDKLFVQKLKGTGEELAAHEWNDEDVADETVVSWGPDTLVKVSGLHPDTDYVIRVKGANMAGASSYSEAFAIRTAPTSRPEAPILVKDDYVCDSDVCELQFYEPDHNGAEVTQYIFEYTKTSDESSKPRKEIIAASGLERPEAGAPLRINLNFLEPDAEYRYSLVAQNSMGESEKALGKYRTSDDMRTAAMLAAAIGPSTAAIVGIVVLVALACLAAIDVACYFLNQCGLLMCVCVNCCGKTPPSVKAKEVLVEEGKMTTQIRYAATQRETVEEKHVLKEVHNGQNGSGGEKEPEDKLEGSEEDTPMIKYNKKDARDTTV